MYDLVAITRVILDGYSERERMREPETRISLNHDFLLLDRETDGEWELTQFIHDTRAIHLHDDLVRYMGDTLAWVPTYNPVRQERHHGLCMWGSTIIDVTGAGAAEQVFRAW